LPASGTAQADDFNRPELLVAGDDMTQNTIAADGASIVEQQLNMPDAAANSQDNNGKLVILHLD
jgi:hypothetical protein